MIVLHESDEATFNHWGLGIMSDAIEPEVVEELNGQFNMEMKYPITGNNYAELKVDRLLRMDASQRLADQLFRIVRIIKKPNELVHVYAEHVSNYTSDLQLKPSVAFSGNGQQVLNQWSLGIVTDHPFNVYSNMTATHRGVWESEEIENARQALGGTDSSILDIFGGEFVFDNYNIRLVKQRGVYNDIPILYGKNLVDLDQEEEIASTYTSVMPYATFEPEDADEPVILTLPEYFIDSEHIGLHSRRKILKVDFSSDDITTVESLRRRTEQYIEDNDIGIPKVNLKVKFVELSKTVDYQDIARVEEIGLGDRVIVEFEELGVSQKAKVITTRFNPVTKQYNEIEVGEMRNGLTTTIDKTVGGQIDRVDKEINRVQMAANGKNKIFRGNKRPTQGVSKNDLWYRPVGDGQVELYQFDGGSWQLIVHDGMSDEVRQALEEAEQDIENARKHVEALDEEANSILAGLGVEDVGHYHTKTVNYIRANVKDRIDEVEELDNGTRRIIAEIKQNPEGELVGYQTVKETTELYERVIGGTSSGEEGVKSNVARIVMADNIFRREIKDGITGVNSRVTQLSNSFDVRINDGDAIVSTINASTKGVYVKGKYITLDGDTDVAGDFRVTGDMVAGTISASKIKTGTLNAAEMNIINLNANSISTGKLNGIEVEGLYGYIGDWSLRGGVLYSPLINGGHTTLKATGDVALGTQSPSPFGTTNAGLQIWHNGNLRWKNGEGLIWPGVTSGLVIQSKSYIHLRPSASVEVDGRVIPRYSGQGTLGADDKRWYRSYVTVAESVVSDARLKANIKDIPDELIEMLMSLRVKSYEIEGKKHFGYIAQDVERVLYKYAVNKVGHENASGYVKEFDMLGKTESYLSLVYTEIATLKAEEAQRRIETLEQRLEALENGE